MIEPQLNFNQFQLNFTSRLSKQRYNMDEKEWKRKKEKGKREKKMRFNVDNVDNRHWTIRYRLCCYEFSLNSQPSINIHFLRVIAFIQHILYYFIYIYYELCLIISINLIILLTNFLGFFICIHHLSKKNLLFKLNQI